jgi:hypothetical protein
MAYVDWRIKGPQLSTCNCQVGCPCQFNGLPTYGDCRAAVAMRIDQGHFGDVPLDGLHWVSLVAWPGAIHEGDGQCLAVIDERADEGQRSALLTILSGDETEPGATIFNVFASTFTTVHPPQFRPIVFSADIAARIGHFAVPGLIEASTGPILNPITREPHRVRVVMPDGFEYREAEFAQGNAKAGDPLALDWTSGHAHLCTMHITPHGPVE